LSGALSELAVPPGGGLAEVIHAVFLPNNVLGAVFNFYGPRAPRLAEYLRTVAASVCPAEISVAPLLRHDVSTSLQKLKSIKILTLRVDKAAIEAVKRANETVGLALAATLEAAEGSEVEIVLRTKRRSRLARLAEPMVQFVRDLAQLPEVVRPGSKLLVKGEFDGETTLRELDIVREEFFLKRTIPLANQKTRALETTAAYTAISSAYEIMKADIEAASSVQLHE
jgi:hypothetical protein